MAANINADALLEGAAAVEKISSMDAYAPIAKATNSARSELLEITRNHETCLDVTPLDKISSNPNSNSELGLFQCFEKLRLFASTLTTLANMYKDIESTDSDKQKALEDFINTNISSTDDDTDDEKEPTKTVIPTTDDIYDNTGATVVSVAGATFTQDTRPRIETGTATLNETKNEESDTTSSIISGLPNDKTENNTNNTNTNTENPSTGDESNNSNTNNGGNTNSGNNTNSNTNNGSNSNTTPEENTGSNTPINNGNTNTNTGSANTGGSTYYGPSNSNSGNYNNSGYSNNNPTTIPDPSADAGNAATTTPSAPESDAGIVDNSGEELDVISIDKGSTSEPSTSSSGGGSVIPAVLGVGAAGAAAVAGVKFIKNKKEKENTYEDESSEEDNAFSYLNDNQEMENDSYSENISTGKYKAGNVNDLVLDDAPDDLKIESSMKDITDQKEELE